MEPTPVETPPRNVKGGIKVFLGVFGCLTLITVFALLLMVPVFSSNDYSEQLEICKGNLARLGRAAILYSEKNGGHLPGKDWDKALAPYEGDEVVYSCPVQRRIDPRTSGYALNAEAAGKLVKDLPTDTVLFFDSNELEHGSVASQNTMPVPGRHRRGMLGAGVTVGEKLVDIPAR